VYSFSIWNRIALCQQPLADRQQVFSIEGRYSIGRGGRITLAGFYKKIDNPIENVAFVQGGTLFTGSRSRPQDSLQGRKSSTAISRS
jgi:hypothetical protein